MKLATSTGFAIRPMGIVPRICFMISGLSITPLIKGVSIAPSCQHGEKKSIPGARALIRILSAAYSIAAAFVNPATACLVPQ